MSSSRRPTSTLAEIADHAGVGRATLTTFRYRSRDRENRFVPTDDGVEVVDSRYEESQIHRLSSTEVEILRGIDLKGWNPKSITRQTRAEPAEVEAALARLRELHLIFEENGRSMSLVLGVEGLEEPLPNPKAKMAADPRVDPQASLGA